ncbi:MAG: LptF/LptG family permease [Gammaproteobacteria bacterium]|nr:LptF/LptG family permease [Gammaproteobacteria bacterium]
MPTLLDRYLLRQLLPAFALCLGTVLIALLLERLLRLFDILAENSHALPAVFKLVLNLVPHYLGLALPAAFFVALFVVVSKLGDENELDAYLAGGQSIARLTRPFLVVSLLLSLLSAAVFGWLQPYARYNYRAVMYSALNAGWDARLQPGTFASAGSGYTLTADEVDNSGRKLKRVFIRRDVDGREELTVGETGALTPSADSRVLKLTLNDGEHVRDKPGSGLLSVRYQRMESNTAFTPDAPPFRARGGNERELTAPELLAGGLPGQDAPISAAKLIGEFNGRLARTLSLPLLPLLAIPLGMSAKRGKRTASLIVAAVLMLLFHNSLQLGESLAESGKVNAYLGVWLPWLVFAGLCGWIYSQSLARPGDNPVTRAVSAVEDVVAALLARLKPAAKAR